MPASSRSTHVSISTAPINISQDHLSSPAQDSRNYVQVRSSHPLDSTNLEQDDAVPETQVTSSHSGELGSGRRYEGDSVVQDSYALEAGQDKSSIPENPCSQFDEIGQRPEESQKRCSNSNPHDKLDLLARPASVQAEEHHSLPTEPLVAKSRPNVGLLRTDSGDTMAPIISSSLALLQQRKNQREDHGTVPASGSKEAVQKTALPSTKQAHQSQRPGQLSTVTPREQQVGPHVSTSKAMPSEKATKRHRDELKGDEYDVPLEVGRSRKKQHTSTKTKQSANQQEIKSLPRTNARKGVNSTSKGAKSSVTKTVRQQATSTKEAPQSRRKADPRASGDEDETGSYREPAQARAKPSQIANTRASRVTRSSKFISLAEGLQPAKQTRRKQPLEDEDRNSEQETLHVSETMNVVHESISQFEDEVVHYPDDDDQAKPQEQTTGFLQADAMPMECDGVGETTMHEPPVADADVRRGPSMLKRPVTETPSASTHRAAGPPEGPETLVDDWEARKSTVVPWSNKGPRVQGTSARKKAMHIHTDTALSNQKTNAKAKQSSTTRQPLATLQTNAPTVASQLHVLLPGKDHALTGNGIDSGPAESLPRPLSQDKRLSPLPNDTANNVLASCRLPAPCAAQDTKAEPVFKHAYSNGSDFQFIHIGNMPEKAKRNGANRIGISPDHGPELMRRAEYQASPTQKGSSVPQMTTVLEELSQQCNDAPPMGCEETLVNVSPQKQPDLDPLDLSQEKEDHAEGPVPAPCTKVPKAAVTTPPYVHEFEEDAMDLSSPLSEPPTDLPVAGPSSSSPAVRPASLHVPDPLVVDPSIVLRPLQGTTRLLDALDKSKASAPALHPPIQAQPTPQVTEPARKTAAKSGRQDVPDERLVRSAPKIGSRQQNRRVQKEEVEDPDKTLVDQVQDPDNTLVDQDCEDVTSDDSMSDDSSDLTTIHGDEPSCASEGSSEAEDTWTKSLAIHQTSLLDGLTSVARHLIRYLVDREVAIADIIKDYRRDGSLLVDVMRSEHAIVTNHHMAAFGVAKEDLLKRYRSTQRQLAKEAQRVSSVQAGIDPQKMGHEHKTQEGKLAALTEKWA